MISYLNRHDEEGTPSMALRPQVWYRLFMFCPHCGKENAGPFGYCIVCGKPLSMVEGAPVVTPAMPSGSPAPPKSMGVLGVLGIGLCVVLAIAVAFTKPIDEQGTPAFQQGFRIGTLFGMLLLPFLIAYVISGRKKARNPRAFAVIFCIVCLLGLGSTLVSSVSFETPEQRIGRLAREAAGLQPEKHVGSSSQRRFDFRGIIYQAGLRNRGPPATACAL